MIENITSLLNAIDLVQLIISYISDIIVDSGSIPFFDAILLSPFRHRIIDQFARLVRSFFLKKLFVQLVDDPFQRWLTHPNNMDSFVCPRFG